jgi:release factor glutamine methyltransferase
MTLREALTLGRDLLKEAAIEEYETDAWLLLEAACGCTRNDLFLRGNEEISPAQEAMYQSFLEKRGKRIPLQHILGVQYFMGLEFKVTPAVLIPRFDTEILVEEVLKYVDTESTVLDMCTGSGCIAVSIASLSKATVTGVDISQEALEIAKCNAEHNQVSTAEFLESDMFQNVTGTFDVIVSNPPYIPSKDVLELMPEVKEHEPMMALDGSEDGLFFYRILAEQAADFLNPEGLLIMEIGYNQAEDVKKLLANNNFIGIRVIKDLAGHDRVVGGWRK